MNGIATALPAPSFRAAVGDRIAVECHGARRLGQVLQILGFPGDDLYRVRWDDGRETIVSGLLEFAVERGDEPVLEEPVLRHEP